ncbi:Uncharacterized protein PBTT_02824 [Plasmodiophora brassicae]
MTVGTQAVLHVYRRILVTARRMQRHRSSVRKYVTRVARYEFRRELSDGETVEQRFDIAARTAAFLIRALNEAGPERKTVNGLVRSLQSSSSTKPVKKAIMNLRREALAEYFRVALDIQRALRICLVSDDIVESATS